MNNIESACQSGGAGGASLPGEISKILGASAPTDPQKSQMMMGQLQQTMDAVTKSK
jgi:hypothetical protein